MELASAVENALKTPTTIPSPPAAAPEATPSAEKAEDADAMQDDAEEHGTPDKEDEADEHEADEEDEHEEDEHEEDEHEEDEHEEDEEEEPEEDEEDDEPEEEGHDEHDDDHDETSAALTSLEAQVAALREKADALEQKEEIAEEDMVTLNITLHGMHKELEAACAKMKGAHDKALNRCQLDVTDSLSQVVRKVLTTKPKDKKAEDHQVTFAKHAPALFYSRPEVCNSPTTVVLRRVFAVPTGSRVRPWSDGGYGYGCGYGTQPDDALASPSVRSSRGVAVLPNARLRLRLRLCCTTGPGPGPDANALDGRVRNAHGAAALCGPQLRVRRSQARQIAEQSPTQDGRRVGYAVHARASTPTPTWRGAPHGPCPRAGGPPHRHRRRATSTKCAPTSNSFRTMHKDSRGARPLAQGGQRFVFPTAVLPVMAPSYYPATGPVSV